MSLRPSTATSSLSQVTVMPTGVGAVCSSSSFVPTEPLPSSSASATLIQQVFSARATSAGVANTSSVPLPMVFAVLAAVTSTLCSPRIPVSNVIYFPLLLRAVWRILFLNTFIRYHILHQNAPYFALFCEFLFFFLRKRAAMEQKDRHSMNKFAFAQRSTAAAYGPGFQCCPLFGMCLP